MSRGKNLADLLDDETVSRLNSLLPWSCFTLDSKGRPIGRPHSATKRAAPQAIPDPRVIDFSAKFDLKGATILEVGCFEGVHTIGLCSVGANVFACDARLENIVKTLTRCHLYGFRPEITLLDADSSAEIESLMMFDFVFHVGVLYHLTRPAESLRQTLSKCRKALLLDTHISSRSGSNTHVVIDKKAFPAELRREGGVSDPFSGISAYAVWLSLEAIEHVATSSGFEIQFLEQWDQRNGTRAMMYLSRVKEVNDLTGKA